MNYQNPIYSFTAKLTFAVAIAAIGSSLSSLSVADEAFDRASLAIKDRVDLKSGARIVGTFIEEKKEDGRTFIVFKSEGGVSMKLDKARHVSKVHQVSVADIEYNKLLAGISDTAEDHLRLYQWCDEQKSGRVRYKDQIRFHLERVMELDPNDEKVKQRLGYMYLKHQGRWVPKELYYNFNGYERKGAGWMPKLQADVNRAVDEKRVLEGELRNNFKIWRKKLRKSKSKADTDALVKQLFQFCDARSVNVVRDEAMEEEDVKLRWTYIDAIGKVKTYDAMVALGYFAVEDPNSELRDRALTLLQQKDFYPKDEVAAKLMGYLGGKNRAHLLQAAYALGELGSESAILPLTNVLITRHQVLPFDDPNRMKSTFGPDGQLDSFSTGGGDPSTKFRDYQNQPVASALKKITGEDLGYSSKDWQNWYVEHHTLYDTSLRD